jgi:hypothetical protein
VDRQPMRRHNGEIGALGATISFPSLRKDNS